MSWKSITLLAPILYCSTTYALVEQKIDEKKPLKITLSKTSHNRISIENGSVEKVFGDESYFSINLDRTTGNAFVTVTRDILNEITLTVVTNSGVIQDLIVTSSEKPSEHLILKETEESDDFMDLSPNLHGTTVDFLNQILEGRSPLGYGQRPLTDQDSLQLPSPLDISPIKAFEGPFENIIVYSIKNTGKDPIIIDSQSLKKEKVSWVFLNAHELKGKEQLLCVISYQKNEAL